jgi:GT2 family glycosyltransferase
MRATWERGWRGRLYVFGRRVVPLPWRRAIRRHLAPERLLGIRKPPADIPHYDFDPNEARPGRPDVLLLPVIAWSYRRQRPQQLAEALARRGRRVFYGALQGPDEPVSATGAAPGVLLLPIAGVRREDPADRRLEGAAIEEAFESLARAREEYGLFETAVVVQTPFWTPLARRLRERFGWKTVYDCLDAHAVFATNRADLLAAAEEELLSEADLVVATSEVLRERLSEARRSRGKPDARLLPNACDSDLFESVPDPDPRTDLAVGYVGAVDDWFDTELLESVARLRPAWRFEIVGGIEGNRVSFARELPNVVFHGERPYSELAALRSRFAVEIIPFRLSKLTDAVDPVKLYEAAAAGRPLVATPMQSLLPHAGRGLVRLAASPEDFVREIEAAAAGAAVEAPRLRAFARDNTWDHRVEELDGWIRELYPRVSIVLVTHDGIALTRLCLESLDRRTDWPTLEILAVDNGSTDGTRQWLEEEASRRGENFQPIAFSENRGFAPAVNAAAAAARGEYLCLLNNDTIVTRGWLSALVRHLERDPGLGMVGASTNETANAAKVEVGYRDPEDLEPWARAFTRAGAGRAEAIDMLTMFCVLMRREVFKAVGPLDERYAVGMFEDDDYSRRLRDRGLRLAVARDSFVHHWGRGTFGRLPDSEYRRIYEENRRRFEGKWGAPARPGPGAAAANLVRLAEQSGALFVFPPTIGWDVTLVQRPHHLARALSRMGFPVVFELEGDNHEALEEVEPRLFLWSGPAGDLARLPSRVVWSFAYNVPPEETLRGARLVYDVIDALEIFPHPRRRLARDHVRALDRAEAVFAVSRPLLEKVRRVRPDAVYLPNGVDFARYEQPPDEAAVPEAISRSRRAGRPAAGYVGALARWLDGDLLRALAALRPDWDFFLVGEALDDSLSGVLERAPGNLIFVGPRPYAAVPSILASFDVGLIPRRGPEGFHMSPIKLYEYLAAGLPILSTPIPECEGIPEVRTASDAAGFSSGLDPARQDRSSPAFRARALARARANDWSRRAVTALETLGLAPRAEPVD